MEKKIFSKILSTILVLSLILSVFVPMGNIIGAAAEIEVPSYSSVLNKVADCQADGWTASFSSDPQGGVAFTDKAAVSDLYECWSGGITRRQSSINWHHNAGKANEFSNMGALTYTAQKYKYFIMTIEYKFDKNNYPKPIVTFNQQNTTPQMFYKTNSAVTDPSYSEDPVGVYFEYEGSINIAGKKTGSSRKGTTALTGTEWHKAQITVTPGNLHVAVYNTDGTIAVENSSTLSADYQGGYISLMQNGVNFFRNISITKIEYDGDYSSALNKVANCQADGWAASFSSNPQGGVAFTNKSAVSDLYECWSGGITRRQENYNKSNNWNNANTFSNMAALTYTVQKYKYFTMTVEYKYQNNSNPWPVVTFNQQNTTPEMFYKANSYVSNLSYSEDPIGVYFEYEGHATISGKKTGTSRKTVGTNLTGTEWHKAQITVSPGNVYVAVYNTDGTVAVENNATLSADYQGGYISLMQNGVNFFRNISITKLDYDGDYSSVLNKVADCQADGWAASFSSNPQGGVAFTNKSAVSDLYECWSGGITRRQENYNKSNNWNNANTFSNMAALTYTVQKYKYFTMTVDYKFNSSSVPWPVITFNQQNETPEMFYKANSYVSNLSYSEDPIGVYFEYEGHATISGKKTGTSRKKVGTNLTGTEWHKAEITVTPGNVYVAVYNTDGTVAVENNATLSADYQGGYISLMQNGVNFFRNISIIEYPEVSIANYSVTPDGNGGIATDKVMVERTRGENVAYKDIAPERAGYSFMGFYSDANFKNAVSLIATIDRKATIYTKWSDFADITVDGKIDLKDLVRIKKMSASIETATVAADLDFDGTNANGSDITVLRKKLMGEDVSSSVSSAAELMNDGILYPLGRTMVLDGAVEMDHVNTGFVLKGNFEGDVKADFTTNRTGSLLNVSVDGGENNIVDLNLDGLTTLAEDLEKGEHTIEVISGTSTKYTTTPDTERGTQAFDGTLQLNKLYYNGIPATYESDKTSKILFIGDQITCGMGLGTDLSQGGYKESNSYYSYASVLGRMLNAEVEVNARCGAKVCHFVWADCGASNNEGRGKGLCNGIDWIKSINVRNSTEYDYANNQPDIVVINLGTNDIPYAKDENGKWVDIWDDTGDEKYSNDVSTLLKRVHNFYPNAKIVWTVGMMDRNTEISQEYIGYFKSYVETWSAANENSAYFLDLSSVADLSGHNGHPTVEGHSIAAAEIYDFILENNIGVNLSDLAELNSVQKKK